MGRLRLPHIREVLKGGKDDERNSRSSTESLEEGSVSKPQAGKYDDRPPSLEGIVDLSDTEDSDHSTRWAAAVTHEIIKPIEHHIREERIYREIHNHDVYHRIQPVREIEILPARHFVRDSDGDLNEVSAEQLPGCTGQNQRWAIVENQPPRSSSPKKSTRLSTPEVIQDKTYTTQEGLEKRSTTIRHPRTLEDMSSHKGPALTLRFRNPTPDGIFSRTIKDEHTTE
ncbi:hypothetical protein BS50DRAFT_582494 [Corynespora cassiicola Philippines]|uniref:Uncharacterized protein n=1 Tax=Corynespora cassiicola Philippines TaxID=1448308 RepID=A0A2T2P5G8_CORCC|nr:hypothetical protein BS50DRAFT_582494 [Corynespora cassiicola Philippines]